MDITKDQIKITQDKFAAMQSKEDLVKLLSLAKDFYYAEKTTPFELKSLSYYANPTFSGKKRYKQFTIRKKSGGTRTIHAPVKGLKDLLTALNVVIQCMYKPHTAATGFIPNKSVVDNARVHVGKNYVYNIDMKDFFYAFDRNRVKMGFMFEPFNLLDQREPLAFLLASLVTHPFEKDGKKQHVLMQGSPASPAITNLLSIKLDRRLSGLAKRFGAKYSRYADDITFSCNQNVFHKKEFQAELKRIIEKDQQLKINPDKTRLQKNGYRQETTGLVVNEKVNVRRHYIKQLRMWLFYWEKYGYAKAEQIFKKDYLKDKGHVKKGTPNMASVISGKLEYLKMVKGRKDSTYNKLKARFDTLNSKRLPFSEILAVWEKEGIEKAMEKYNTEIVSA